MNRRWVVIAASIVLIVILFFVIGRFKKSKSSLSSQQRTTESKMQVVSQNKASVDDLLVQIQEKLASGDYQMAKQLCEEALNIATSQDEMETINQLMQEVNFRIIMNPVPIEGKTVEYEVKPGDTLYKIAKKFGVTVEFIKKRNHLKSDLIKPGQRLSIYMGKFSIVVDKSQNLLMLYSDGQLIKTYKVSTGKDNLTPEGEFKIVTKLKNPTFFHNGKAIPPGDPENILGTRWLGFDYGNGSYGIHGTTSPQTIGTYETNGCVRMKNEDVEELYDIVPTGTKVKVVQ